MKHSLPSQLEYGASFWRKYTGDGCLSRLDPNISNISPFPGNVAIISGSFVTVIVFSATY